MEKEIPLFDLSSQFDGLEEEIVRRIEGVIREKKFVLGRYCKELEEKISEYVGVPYAVSCASGTDALILSLMAIGIKEGDEIITTPYTFFSTVSSIVLTGGRPVFVDIGKDMNIDPSLIEGAITEKTKAIIVVHLFGKVAQMDLIQDLARRHRLVLIEDMAQALGARFRGMRAGTFGDVACLSFYPTKNLGGIGEGGMVLTKDEDLYRRLKMLRVHGVDNEPYKHLYLGINSRLDEIKASALVLKLPFLDDWNRERVKIAAFYNEALKGLPVLLPELEDHVFHLYVVRCRRRNELKEFLKKKGVHTGIYYPLPLHLQPCLSFLGYREGDFLEAENASRESLALPCYPGLKEEDLLYVTSCIREFFCNGVI